MKYFLLLSFLILVSFVGNSSSQQQYRGFDTNCEGSISYEHCENCKISITEKFTEIKRVGEFVIFKNCNNREIRVNNSLVISIGK